MGRVTVSYGFRVWLSNVTERYRWQTGAHVMNGSGPMIERGLLGHVPVAMALAR